MPRLVLMLTATVIIAASTHARAASRQPTEIEGHFIGETMSAFLHAEPEARQQVNLCRQHPDRAKCPRLLTALARGQRTQISTSGSKDFILDGRKLVSLTMFVGGAAAIDLTKKFGSPSRQTIIVGQDTYGARWENHLYGWETHDADITLYQDNDPMLQDRRSMLIVESHGNQDGGKYTVSAKELARALRKNGARYRDTPAHT